MYLGFPKRIRHPLFPRVAAIPAGRAPRVCPALAGTLEELRRAATAGSRATRAVFAVVEQDRPLLTAAERDFLWETFQVPAYVLLRDDSGKILAYECEAQDGFHTESANLTLAGATLMCSPCECGRPGNRLQVTECAVVESSSARV